MEVSVQTARSYVRRKPEGGVLCKILSQELETFLLQVDYEETRSALPAFVRRELRKYLSCGVLEHGFARVHCLTCGQDGLVAFSCKRRGGCPSCGARRIVDQAAHWMDHVLPDVPVRQWGLSLPHEIRYRIAFDPKQAKGDAAGLSAGLSDDVTRLLERRPDLSVSILADGAPEMWNLLEPYLDPEIVVAHKLVDFYHLIEKLSPAAKVIHGDEDGRVKLARWKRTLLRRSGAAVQILEDLRQSGCEHHKVGTHQPVHDAITYLENHSERLNYAHARRRGLPLGSGNVEATCKTLVGIRMKRAGSRWKEKTGEHIIRLRALGLSDRWDSAMDKLHVAYRTSVGIAA